MSAINDESIDLVVTSPPYPMISMWDDLFINMNNRISVYLESDGNKAFELIHSKLDKTWSELKRVMKPGGIVCINIGDATRKVGETFSIYPNHSRITMKMMELGFEPLPELIWHKQTNAPNKFMGSGMLPIKAYITLEHEYILIFRNPGKREFKGADKSLRQKSAFFWEERNEWFSDVWDFKGEKQGIKSGGRERSAAFPYELPKRLILMYSLLGDCVLDPFLGTGTTTKAAMIYGRNNIGYELLPELIGSSIDNIMDSATLYSSINVERIRRHIDFINNRRSLGKEINYVNEIYSIPVMTAYEKNIQFYGIKEINRRDGEILVSYRPIEKSDIFPDLSQDCT